MMMSIRQPFSLGQRVRALHGEWQGRVVRLGPSHHLCVATDDGFELQVLTADVVAEATTALPQRHLPQRSKESHAADPTSKTDRKPNDALRSETAKVSIGYLDLHLDQMPERYQQLADREGALAAQLAYLDAAVTDALDARSAKLIVLHGRGSGSLRRAIQQRLRRRPEILAIEPDTSGQFGLGSALVLRLSARLSS